MSLEAAAITIRGLLFADVFANLLQLETHRGHCVSTGPEVLAREFRSLPHKRAIAMALFPFRNPITEATGYFGGIAMHMCTWSGSRCPSMIWHSFCRAKAWNTSPNLRRAWPNSTLRRRLGTNTT